jgi:hypothetical protein
VHRRMGTNSKTKKLTGGGEEVGRNRMTSSLANKSLVAHGAGASVTLSLRAWSGSDGMEWRSKVILSISFVRL